MIGMFILGLFMGAFVGALVIGLCASAKENDKAKDDCILNCKAISNTVRITAFEILTYFKIKLLEHRTDEHGILWKDIDEVIEDILKEVNSEHDNT